MSPDDQLNNANDTFLFRLTVDDSENFEVYSGPEADVFIVGSPLGERLIPIYAADLLSAVVRLTTDGNDSVEVDEVTATGVAWGQGDMAEALLPSLDRTLAAGGFVMINGTEWIAEGDGFAYPTDFDQSGTVLAQECWTNSGQGMPMMPDRGTYYLMKLGSRYLVVHRSGVGTTLEATLSVHSDEAAIREFEGRWSGYGDPDLDNSLSPD